MKLSPAAKELRRDDLVKLYQKVQGWREEMQQKISEKQQTLLVPIQTKALEAIKTVAKENGFTYILNESSLLVSPPADDILPLVKRKLGIKDPAPASTPGKPAPTKPTR